MLHLHKILTGIGIVGSLLALDFTISMASESSSEPMYTYQMGALTPVRALALPSIPQSRSEDSRVELPVVRVSGVYAFRVNALAAPMRVWADVPSQLAPKLAAYFVQMDQTTSFYLIGPRGMAGTVELRADGSFDVLLKNAHTAIELGTPGGSVMTTWVMAAPFFSSARNSLIRSGLDFKPRPLSHVTVKRPNTNTALFAFIDQRGYRVAGYAFYQPQWNSSAFGASAQMVFRADKSGWQYAPWVLGSAVSTLDNVGEPQIGGQVLREGDQPYMSEGPYYPVGAAIKVGQRLVWLQNQTYVQRGAVGFPGSHFPIMPFTLMVAADDDGRLVPNSEMEMAEIPWMRSFMADNQPLYDNPFLLTPTLGRFLPYIEIWAGYGMNQPETNDLYVFDLNSQSKRLITSFQLFGGRFFSVGTSGNYLAYDKSCFISAKGRLSHNIQLVNLSTGQQTHLPAPDLHGVTVITKMKGQTIRIKLMPID